MNESDASRLLLCIDLYIGTKLKGDMNLVHLITLVNFPLCKGKWQCIFAGNLLDQSIAIEHILAS